MDDIDQEAAEHFSGFASRLRAQRIKKRLGARTEEQHCADCKAGACAVHLKDEDAALFDVEDPLAVSDAGAEPTQE